MPFATLCTVVVFFFFYVSFSSSSFSCNYVIHWQMSDDGVHRRWLSGTNAMSVPMYQTLHAMRPKIKKKSINQFICWQTVDKRLNQHSDMNFKPDSKAPLCTDNCTDKTMINNFLHNYLVTAKLWIPKKVGKINVVYRAFKTRKSTKISTIL